jgi:hypothetical protein
MVLPCKVAVGPFGELQFLADALHTIMDGLDELVQERDS